jgi:hypothetical protein
MSTCMGSTVRAPDVVRVTHLLAAKPASEAKIVSGAMTELRSLAATVSGSRPSQMSYLVARLSGSLAPVADSRTTGLRNRLFLKYWGIDFEFYDRDMRYAGTP